MTTCVLFLTSRYFNKGAHYSFITVSLVLVLNPPKHVFSNITYSWMKQAVSDTNVKKASSKKMPDCKISCVMHLNGFIFVCTFKINEKSLAGVP